MTEHELGHGEQLIEDLRNWASDHADKSGGQLGVLPYEPGVYPGQDSVSVHGDPQSAAVVNGVAGIAQPRYPEITKRLEEQEQETGEVSRVGELLHGGNNVILVTNHSDLIDIAVTHAAFYGLLERLGYRVSKDPENPRVMFSTGIVISKMVSFLAYRLGDEMAPAAEVLKILENETFLSYPRTESSRKHGIGRLIPNEIDRHNRHMRERVEHLLGQGAVLFAVAASGSTDKPLEHNPDTIVMGPVTNGTRSMMVNPRHKHEKDKDNKTSNYLLPVGVYYGTGEAVLRIADMPRAITSEDVVINGMKRIASTLNEHVEGKTFVFNG